MNLNRQENISCDHVMSVAVYRLTDSSIKY